MPLPLPRSALFPYTTLFRSGFCCVSVPPSPKSQLHETAPGTEERSVKCTVRDGRRTRAYSGQVATAHALLGLSSAEGITSLPWLAPDHSNRATASPPFPKHS